MKYNATKARFYLNVYGASWLTPAIMERKINF
jgi:hypothetical protein